MAQNDWSFIYLRQSGDAQGVAVFHDQLSNPLTNEEHGVGTYCRRFGHANWGTSSPGSSGFFMYSNNQNMISVPDTKAISIRSWIRFAPSGTSYNTDAYYGIIAKATSTAYNTGGYFLYIRDDGFCYLNGTKILDRTFVRDTWYRLRLDVIPIKHNGVVIMDHLKCFIEVDGEWVMMQEIYIEATDTAFITWSGTRYNGIKSYFTHSYYVSGVNYLYLDKIEMYLETVEQPERLTLSLTNDTGVSDQDNITTDPSITVSQPEVGATISYSTDSINWDSSIPTAVSGSNTLYVRQTSAEGRTSAAARLDFTYVPTDAGPTFVSATSSAIAENGGENQVVYTALATSDLTDVVYTIKEVGDHNNFSVGLNNGNVITLSNLDYETKSSYDITIIATDLAGNSVEQQVVLSVTDVNEAPSLSLSLVYGTEANPLPEDSLVDVVVGTLSGTDQEGDNLVFSVSTQTVEGTFAISGSSLVLTSSLNYEATPQHTVEIAVNDGTNTTTQSYAIKIGDVNDAPVLSVSFSTGTQASPMAESSAVGTVVATLSATDADNDAVSFSIVSQTVDGMFELDGSSLKLAGTLDYETNSTHSIVLRASDGTATVDQSHTIYVADVNEAPVFSVTLTVDPVPEDTEVGTVVGTLSATDPENDSLEFSVVSQSPAGAFEVSGSDLKVAATLDYQSNTSHSLTLRVTDGVNNIDQNLSIDIEQVASGPSDSDFNSVSLLLKMDGSNGSTTFADSSTNQLAVTANGDVQISDSQSKFGGASAYFDGSDDYLTVPTSTELQFGTGDFTIEFWTYLTARVSSNPCLYSNYNSFTAGSLSIFAGHGSANTIAYQVAIAGTFPAISSSTSIVYNQWAHIALVRSSGVVKLYVDGVERGSANFAGSLDGVGATTYIGTGGDSITNGVIKGHIDDVRITKGVARYTADFTPPDTHPVS